MKYLIAIDSDGTIRRSDGSISDRTKKVIKNIINNDNIVVICTARPRYHTLKISEDIGINDYLISSNGTEVYDNINKKIVYIEYLPKDICENIYYDAINKNIRVIFVSDNKEYATQFVRNNSQVLLNEENITEILDKNIKQIMIISKNKKIIKEYQKMVENKYKINIIETNEENETEAWFSIISNQASKGIALKKLAKHLNIPIENTIAIGNDLNDISMFEIAGLSVAVSNAKDNIKKIVDHITLSNDEDGVASFLESLL